MQNKKYRGAESRLYQKKWFDFEALFKVRIPKAYRIKELDAFFRKQRMVYEVRLLTRAKKAGVRVPIIYEIDLPNTTIVMEFIKGEILKTYLPKVTNQEQRDLSYQIGLNIDFKYSPARFGKPLAGLKDYSGWSLTVGVGYIMKLR